MNTFYRSLMICAFLIAGFNISIKAQTVYYVGDGCSWDNWDIYSYNIQDGIETRLTFDLAIDNHPVINHVDTTQVAFSSTRGGGEFDIYVADASDIDGTAVRLTFNDDYPDRHPHWHPNGHQIIYTSKDRPVSVPVLHASECSQPVITHETRYYEGMNMCDLDTPGILYPLDVSTAWDDLADPDIWVYSDATYTGHPSFNHEGNLIVFTAAIDGEGKNWEVYTAGFDPVNIALIPNSLKRVTFGPNDPGLPNTIKMTGGAAFSYDDTEIICNSTRTTGGNSQIFSFPADSEDLEISDLYRRTWHHGNDYVPEAIGGGDVVISSDLGINTICDCDSLPGATDDLDVVLLEGWSTRTILGDDDCEETLLIGDEVSWFCGLKPNLATCTMLPKIMCTEALWLEANAMELLPQNLLEGYGEEYANIAKEMYGIGWQNLSGSLYNLNPDLLFQIQEEMNMLWEGFPGWEDPLLLQMWLDDTRDIRRNKHVVPSIMYEVGLGAPCIFNEMTTYPPWEDSFEDYPLASDIAGQGGWEFWFGAPSSPGARVTSDQVHFGDQALKIIGAEDLTGDDIVHQFTCLTSGIWEVSAWQFIPLGASGGSTYFLLLNQYGYTPEESNWSTQLKFDTDLNIIQSDFEGATLPLVKGEWAEIKVVVDLDNDLQTISYNGELLSSKSWTLGIPQAEPGILNIAAINMVANDLADFPVYYDDFAITNDFGNDLAIICPPDIVVSNDPGLCGAASVDLGIPEIINPDGTEVITNNAPAVFPVGTTSVIWIVSNSGGYTVSCDQLVTVLDEEAPIITSMEDMEAPNDFEQCGAALTWEWPVAADNCGIESLTGNYEPGATFPVGLTDVVYTATDFSGNQSYDGFTVAVLDTEGPQFQSEMPDLEAPNDPGLCGAVLSWEWPIPNDNGGIESMTGNYEPGATFPVGLTEVVYTATLLWDWPIVSDNCGIESLTVNYEPGMFFPVGLTDVVYTATDVSGNQSFDGFVVTVFDTDPPELNCPGDMTVSQSSPPFTLNGATPEGGFYEGPGVFDGVFYPADAGVGTHQISYLYANLSSGCTYACGFSITVAGGAAQTIAIPQGWSGISSYIQPTVPLMDFVLNPIIDELTLLYNFEGMFYPGQNIYTLGEWNTHSGYVIKVTEDVLLPINGEETPDKTLFLDEGWTPMPVLNNEFFDIEYLFAGIDDLIIVKEVAGQGVYWNQFGINTLGFVVPGKSYYVLMSAPATIDFGIISTKSHYDGKPAEIITSPWNAVVPGPASHVVAFSLAENVFQNRDIVGGFNTGGACTGLVQLTDAKAAFALSVFGNTAFAPLADGLEPGEAISYKLFRPSTDETFDLEVRYNAAMNTGHFETNGLSEVKLVKLAPVDISDFQTLKVSVYPNPGDGTFTVDGNGEQVELDIFNTFGEQVYSSDVALPYKVNISDRSAGVYFIKITSTKGGYYGKLIIK